MLADKDLDTLIFLRDLHFGFLPDDCEVRFAGCFERFSSDETFAWKCLHLALLSRNEDLVRILLDHLHVTRYVHPRLNLVNLDLVKYSI